MTDKTHRAFVAHVRSLEARCIAGDEDATKSLACMALLAEGWRPGDDDPDGGEIIDLAQYRAAA